MFTQTTIAFCIHKVPFSDECVDCNNEATYDKEQLHPYTVVWYNNLDHCYHIHRVTSADPNEAVVDAVRKHGWIHWTKDEVQVCCVVEGHSNTCMIEADDRFSWFS